MYATAPDKVHQILTWFCGGDMWGVKGQLWRPETRIFQIQGSSPTSQPYWIPYVNPRQFRGSRSPPALLWDCLPGSVRS